MKNVPRVFQGYLQIQLAPSTRLYAHVRPGTGSPCPEPEPWVRQKVRYKIKKEDTSTHAQGTEIPKVALGAYAFMFIFIQRGDTQTRAQHTRIGIADSRRFRNNRTATFFLLVLKLLLLLKAKVTAIYRYINIIAS